MKHQHHSRPPLPELPIQCEGQQDTTKLRADSHGKLPDFGIGDIQLQVHEVPLPTLVQLAVLRNLGQEGVLGIKRSAGKDKNPLDYSPVGS